MKNWSFLKIIDYLFFPNLWCAFILSMCLFHVLKHGKMIIFSSLHFLWKHWVFKSEAACQVLQWWNSVLLWLTFLWWLMQNFYWNLLILQVAGRDIPSSKCRYVNLTFHNVSITKYAFSSIVFVCLPVWEFMSRHYISHLLIGLIDRLNYPMIVSSHHSLFQWERIVKSLMGIFMSTLTIKLVIYSQFWTLRAAHDFFSQG